MLIYFVSSIGDLLEKFAFVAICLVGHVPLGSSVLPPGDQDAVHHLFLWWSCHLARMQFVPSIPFKIWSIDLCQMVGAEDIPIATRLYRHNPLCVLIVKYSDLWLFLHLHLMVCLSEVNVGELLPASLANVINAREGVLLCLHLGIFCDLIVTTDAYCPTGFDDRYYRCRPVTEFDLV